MPDFQWPAKSPRGSNWGGAYSNSLPLGCRSWADVARAGAADISTRLSAPNAIFSQQSQCENRAGVVMASVGLGFIGPSHAGAIRLALSQIVASQAAAFQGEG
jgi:hypothetical protein